MRRMLATALALVLVAALAAPLGAQPQSFAPVPASGVVLYSGASISAVNTASEVSMFQYVVPAALIASATSVGALGTPVYTGTTSSGLSTVPLSTVPAPLHLQMYGFLNAAAGTSVNLGINFGTIGGGTQAAGTQGAATLTLNNNIVGAATFPLPVYMDVWVQPIATTTATPNAINTAMMIARFQYLNASGTLTTTNAATIAMVNIASPSQLNVVARWAAAAVSSNLSFLSRVLSIGR